MAFHGKVAVITGGGSGMGAVMATRLAQSGAQVAIIDLNERGMAETVAKNAGIHPFTGDVTDGEQLQALVLDVEQRLGPIDRLAAAAGIMPGGPLSEMPAERINKIMQVNYEGTVNTVKAVLPGMLQRGCGDLILFGSLAGVMFSTGMGAYNASKAAVNAFGEVLAYELKGSGLRVLTVRPGAVDTPLIGQATDSVKGLRDAQKKGKMTAPQQVIDAIEAALERGEYWVYPSADARFGQWLRRLSPRLGWKMVEHSNR